MAYTHDEGCRVQPLDPADRHLAQEFRARPRGPHSAALRALLDRMRYGPLAGKYVLIREAPSRWALARLSGRRGVAPVRTGAVFASAEEGEWAVFALRWAEIAGEVPDGDGR